MPGSCNDLNILRTSRIEEGLWERLSGKYCLLGDLGTIFCLWQPSSLFLGNTNSPCILTPAFIYMNAHPDDRNALILATGSVRIAAEWPFGSIKRSFPYVQLVSKLTSSNLGDVTSTLLENVLTCHNQTNQVSKYFGLSPPKLNEYLAL